MTARRQTPWWQIAAGATFLVVAYFVLGSFWESDEGARPVPSVTDVADTTASPEQPSAVPSALPEAQEETWVVTNVIDGDTFDASRGGVVERVRMIGINAPERDECGYDEAKQALLVAIDGQEVFLVSGTRNDRDKHGRLLRFVEQGEPDGTRFDVGLDLIDQGLAEARYDSRSGQPHDREDLYWQADDASPALCSAR